MEHQDFLPLSQPSKGARSSRFNTCTQAQATVHSSLLKSGCHDTPFIFSRCWLVDLEYTHHSHIGFCSRDHQNKKKLRLRRGETTKALIPRLDDVQQGKQKIVTFFTAWGGEKKKSNETMSRTNVDARHMKAATACLATSTCHCQLLQRHVHSLQAF